MRKNKSKHGGKRAGAGRPPTDLGGAMVRLTIYLPRYMAVKAKSAPCGAGEYVRNALRLAEIARRLE